MGIPVTKRRENTRARLLEAAAQLFAEVGLDGASVEAICERAGFTRGAFYSNFASKEELFLDLAASIADQRVSGVRAQIDDFVATGRLTGEADPIELVQQIMDLGADDRLSVLMMSEIHIRALRDEAFAAAYVAQERAMLASIEEIIQGIVDAGLFTLRLGTAETARMLMLLWEGTVVRGVIEGQDGEQLHRTGSQALGRLVELIIAPS